MTWNSKIYQHYFFTGSAFVKAVSIKQYFSFRLILLYATLQTQRIKVHHYSNIYLKLLKSQNLEKYYMSNKATHLFK